MTSRHAKIPWTAPSLGTKEQAYVLDALTSTWISGGPYVERFEKEFLRLNGAEYGLAVSNGTTALQLALLALDVGPGDEVIVPGFTFVAPGNMVIAAGATPVFVDIDPETWCIDPAAVERAITPKTKAIIAVHVYGNVCAMDELSAMAATHHVAVIEDAAEAAFSKYRGRWAGTIGDLACFSFQATKTITTGEGGFVLCRRKDHFDKMRILRDHGMRPGKRYWHEVVGYNFRLTNLQAALGCAQLERADELTAARNAVYRLYHDRLSGRPDLTLQAFRPEVEPVVWAPAMRIDFTRIAGGREAFMQRLLDAGIETRPGFYPFSVLPPYQSPALPVSEAIGLSAVSLPSFAELSADEVGYICDQVETALETGQAS